MQAETNQNVCSELPVRTPSKTLLEILPEIQYSFWNQNSINTKPGILLRTTPSIV